MVLSLSSGADHPSCKLKLLQANMECDSGHADKEKDNSRDEKARKMARKDMEKGKGDSAGSVIAYDEECCCMCIEIMR